MKEEPTALTTENCPLKAFVERIGGKFKKDLPCKECLVNFQFCVNYRLGKEMMKKNE